MYLHVKRFVGTNYDEYTNVYINQMGTPEYHSPRGVLKTFMC